MSRPLHEVADIVRTHGKQFVARLGRLLNTEHLRVLHAIENCRTAVLGGHVGECDQCGHRVISYNSCRNRHCPKCQGAARQQWLADRIADLLPVPYFHVVFTLPHLLGPLALQNKRVVYGILFRAVSETLLEVAADPKRLGAKIGFLAVLHTWGQNLLHHPHLHCVVPGGGLSPDQTRWIPSRPQFLFPVRVLSRVFRGKFLTFLRSAFRQGKLQFHGELANLPLAAGFDKLIDQAHRCEWVVYTKRPFANPDRVVAYLARYTHRVAISNHRIVSIAGDQVQFRWKDYAHGNKQKTMTLNAVEFLRRFFLHVLPKGFVRIRSFGFLANRQRTKLLPICRNLLSNPAAADLVPSLGKPSRVTDDNLDPMPKCPACGNGHLRIVEHLSPLLTSSGLVSAASVDSS